MPELLDCPFCGGEAKYTPTCHIDVVQCRVCGAQGMAAMDQHEAAIAAWNRRAPSAAFRAGAAEMRERAAGAAEHIVITHARQDGSRPFFSATTTAAAIRALPLPAGGSGWRDMTDKPTRPMPVLYWFGKRWWHQADGTPAPLDPVRDPAERTEAGWWNGEEWCETGTGHDLFEPWREERDLPTRWQPLPAAPEEGG